VSVDRDVVEGKQRRWWKWLPDLLLSLFIFHYQRGWTWWRAAVVLLVVPAVLGMVVGGGGAARGSGGAGRGGGRRWCCLWFRRRWAWWRAAWRSRCCWLRLRRWRASGAVLPCPSVPAPTRVVPGVAGYPFTKMGSGRSGQWRMLGECGYRRLRAARGLGGAGRGGGRGGAARGLGGAGRGGGRRRSSWSWRRWAWWRAARCCSSWPRRR
jgi:hypothetical protein